jgi:peptidoglycan/xylan/chitin deacetylase (PgdA/CDA1 family)
MILAYHRINPWYKNDALTVLPENLERQIQYLIKGKFKFVLPESYISELQNGKPAMNKQKRQSTPHPVPSPIKGRGNMLITFDDGYADNLWYAMPVLKKLGITPLIFLTVSYIGTQNIFSRYKDKAKDRFLNWEEVKQLANGVVFGSHSLSHPHLPQVEKERLWSEVSESKRIIEDKIGREVSFFCYPYGDFDERVISAVKKAGYKAAFVTPGIKKKIRKSIYTLPRTGVYGHNSFLTFRIKIWKDYLTERYF